MSYAHVGRNILGSPLRSVLWQKSNAELTIVTSKPNTDNLRWSSTLEHFLDDNIIGEEKLISEDRCYKEDIDSDTEVQEVKRRKLQEAE